MFSLNARILAVAVVAILSHTVHGQRERDTWTSVQSLEVSGQVRSADSNELVANVSVRLERFAGGVVEQMSTDSLGRFRFTGLQRGTYTVVVESPKFNTTRQFADLQVLFKAFLMFELTSSPPRFPGGVAVVIDARVPEPAREEFTKGRAALLDKRAKDAIPHLEKAIFIYSEFFEARLLLGTAFIDLRDWQKAETTLARALEIKPDNPSALLALGEVFWREKRYDEAEKTLLDGLKLDEKNWHGHFTLGRLYWDKGEAMKAGPSVGRTLQLKPDFAEAHLLAGNVLLRLGQQQRAQVEYQEYLRLAPKGEYAAEARELIQKLQKMPASKM